MRSLSFLLVVIGLLSVAATADARPPGHAGGPPEHARASHDAQPTNDKPPINKGVCDELHGATPGLYGLCVAFCEAQRCEPDLSSSDPFKNCKPSSERLLAQYDRRKRPDDPAMPCIEQRDPCPCWSTAEIGGVRHPDDGDRLTCIATPTDTLWAIRGDNDAGAYNTVVHASDTGRCQFSDTCMDGDCLGVVRQLIVTPAEGQACRTQADIAAQFRTLNCRQ